MNPSTPVPDRSWPSTPPSRIEKEILLEDVRQWKKRRWQIFTIALIFILGSFGGLTIWVYGIGERVGSAQTIMGYMRTAADADRVNIGKNSDAIRSMERENAQQYSEIKQQLVGINTELQNLGEVMRRKKGR